MKPAIDSKVITALEKLANIVRNMLQEQAGELRLSPIQVQILIYLSMQPVEQRRISQLAKVFGLTAATISDSVRVLKEKNLVSQARDEKDARIINLELTDKGRAVAAEGTRWADHFYTIIEDFPLKEKEAVLNFLLKLIASLRETGKLPVARLCLLCQFFRRDVHNDSDRPHHCVFLDKSLGIADLKLDCPHHYTRIK